MTTQFNLFQMHKRSSKYRYKLSYFQNCLIPHHIWENNDRCENILKLYINNIVI